MKGQVYDQRHSIDSREGGKLSDYLAILKANMHVVRKEKGCIEYVPAIDVDSKLPPQVLDKNCVTLLERWERLICWTTGKR